VLAQATEACSERMPHQQLLTGSVQPLHNCRACFVSILHDPCGWLLMVRQPRGPQLTTE
jgi:hypothetical protein